MKTRAAKPARKTGVSRRPQPKSSRTAGKHPDAAKPSRPPSRAIVMRLAAEVDALAAQLKDSRARIQELEARVDVDPLTDVFNRRGFERELKRSLAYVKRYGVAAALIYVDLDDFKQINDQFGHDVGDEVLVAVSRRVQGTVRAGDIVARLGGDEFVVAHTAAEPEDVELVVSRIRKSLAAPYQVHGQTLSVAASTSLKASRLAHSSRLGGTSVAPMLAELSIMRM